MPSNTWPSPPLRIAVIGSGLSGLVTLKTLIQQGFSPVCFEMGDRVGGLWSFHNKNGRGGIYQSLHFNSSAKNSQFQDFPLPENAGDFPSHEAMARYFESYARRFELLPSIRFATEVRKCTPMKDGYLVSTFDCATGSQTEEHFDALVVASGHHWDPQAPPSEITAAFTGETFHSSEYIDPVTPTDLSKQRVLVVGIGNSAVDIACELCERSDAASVTLSSRRGAWVLPKYLFGRPIDQGRLIPQWLPKKFRRRLVTSSFRLIFGSMSQYGLPKPDHLIGEAHPTLSSELPALVQAGKIKVLPEMVQAVGRELTFADGSRLEVDVIIYCTGYKVSFPFFPEEHISAPENRLPLFHRVFHPKHRRVFFVGLAQPLGAIAPIAEAQAQVIAQHLAGTYHLPETEMMNDLIDRNEAEMQQRFVASKRHTMQVDPHAFHLALRKDLQRGKTRAERGLGVAFPR
jgi:dimethylaniline monooxygenase (N-oxide forming)